MLSWPSLFHVEQALSVTGFQSHPAPGEAPDLATLLAAILPEMSARERSVARERLAGCKAAWPPEGENQRAEPPGRSAAETWLNATTRRSRTSR